jgi:hypothetical protein
MVIQVQVGKNFIDDALPNGGYGVNIIIKKLTIQLNLSKPNLTFYNFLMVDQTIAKPLGLLRDLKIFVHGIPYIVTFIVMNNNILNFNYSMLLKHHWLRDARVSHDWGTNTITIDETSPIKTIPITKKLVVQTKRPKVLMCYDFHSGISDDEEDIMFAT